MTLDRKDWPEDARNAQDAFDEAKFTYDIFRNGKLPIWR